MSKLVKFKVTNCDLERKRVDSIDSLKQKIFCVRGQRVMLDRDLAQLYRVTTKQLNQQLKRNRHRFPKDFAFQLTFMEAKQITGSRSQNVTLKKGHNIKYRPHAFTEHGAIMLASVLNSRAAVKASVWVVRAFVQMRTVLLEYGHLSHRIDALAASYDESFQEVFHAIRSLMILPRKQRQIGFISAANRAKKARE